MKPNMNFLKSLTKGKNKFMNVFLILAIVVFIGVIYQYNGNKSSFHDNMQNNPFANVGEVPNPAAAPNGSAQPEEASTQGGAAAAAVKPVVTTDGNQYLKVSGLTSGSQSSNTCNSKPVMNPNELLPTDSNTEWSNIMPNKDLKNVGMLNAAHHIGTNTVGSSLRNPNLQIRSEPVIPQQQQGPWNNTTIEPDNMRRSLEIG